MAHTQKPVGEKQVHNRESEGVTSLIPLQLRENSATLIALLEDYYKYLNAKNGPTNIIDRIQSEHDIDLVDDKFLNEIKKEIAKGIPSSTVLTNRQLFRKIVDYYYTRGSQNSAEVFFKLFYDDNISLEFPKETLIRCSAGNIKENQPAAGQESFGYIENTTEKIPFSTVTGDFIKAKDVRADSGKLDIIVEGVVSLDTSGNFQTAYDYINGRYRFNRLNGRYEKESATTHFFFFDKTQNRWVFQRNVTTFIYAFETSGLTEEQGFWNENAVWTTRTSSTATNLGASDGSEGFQSPFIDDGGSASDRGLDNLHSYGEQRVTDTVLTKPERENEYFIHYGTLETSFWSFPEIVANGSDKNSTVTIEFIGTNNADYNSWSQQQAYILAGMALRPGDSNTNTHSKKLTGSGSFGLKHSTIFQVQNRSEGILRLGTHEKDTTITKRMYDGTISELIGPEKYPYSRDITTLVEDNSIISADRGIGIDANGRDHFALSLNAYGKEFAWHNYRATTNPLVFYGYALEDCEVEFWQMEASIDGNTNTHASATNFVRSLAYNGPESPMTFTHVLAGQADAVTVKGRKDEIWYEVISGSDFSNVLPTSGTNVPAQILRKINGEYKSLDVATYRSHLRVGDRFLPIITDVNDLGVQKLNAGCKVKRCASYTKKVKAGTKFTFIENRYHHFASTGSGSFRRRNFYIKSTGNIVLSVSGEDTGSQTIGQIEDNAQIQPLTDKAVIRGSGAQLKAAIDGTGGHNGQKIVSAILGTDGFVTCRVGEKFDNDISPVEQSFVKIRNLLPAGSSFQQVLDENGNELINSDPNKIVRVIRIDDRSFKFPLFTVNAEAAQDSSNIVLTLKNTDGFVLKNALVRPRRYLQDFPASSVGGREQPTCLVNGENTDASITVDNVVGTIVEGMNIYERTSSSYGSHYPEDGSGLKGTVVSFNGTDTVTANQSISLSDNRALVFEANIAKDANGDFPIVTSVHSSDTAATQIAGNSVVTNLNVSQGSNIKATTPVTLEGGTEILNNTNVSSANSTIGAETYNISTDPENPSTFHFVQEVATSDHDGYFDNRGNETQPVNKRAKVFSFESADGAGGDVVGQSNIDLHKDTYVVPHRMSDWTAVTTYNNEWKIFTWRPDLITGKTLSNLDAELTNNDWQLFETVTKNDTTNTIQKQYAPDFSAISGLGAFLRDSGFEASGKLGSNHTSATTISFASNPGVDGAGLRVGQRIIQRPMSANSVGAFNVNANVDINIDNVTANGQIVVGMQVTGTGITGTVLVSSESNFNASARTQTIQLDTAVNIADDAVLTFTTPGIGTNHIITKTFQLDINTSSALREIQCEISPALTANANTPIQCIFEPNLWKFEATHPFGLFANDEEDDEEIYHGFNRNTYNEVKYSFYSDYEDRNGFVSDVNKLHDGEFNQEFSYGVNTSLSLDNWESQYKKLVHPSGMKLFGLLNLESEFDRTSDGSAEYDLSDDDWVQNLHLPVGQHTPFFQPGWLDQSTLSTQFLLPQVGAAAFIPAPIIQSIAQELNSTYSLTTPTSGGLLQKIRLETTHVQTVTPINVETRDLTSFPKTEGITTADLESDGLSKATVSVTRTLPDSPGSFLAERYGTRVVSGNEVAPTSIEYESVSDGHIATLKMTAGTAVPVADVSNGLNATSARNMVRIRSGLVSGRKYKVTGELKVTHNSLTNNATLSVNVDIGDGYVSENPGGATRDVSSQGTNGLHFRTLAAGVTDSNFVSFDVTGTWTNSYPGGSGDSSRNFVDFNFSAHANGDSTMNLSNIQVQFKNLKIQEFNTEETVFYTQTFDTAIPDNGDPTTTRAEERLNFLSWQNEISGLTSQQIVPASGNYTLFDIPYGVQCRVSAGQNYNLLADGDNGVCFPNPTNGKFTFDASIRHGSAITDPFTSTQSIRTGQTKIQSDFTFNV